MVLANEREIHPDVDELYGAQGNAAARCPRESSRAAPHGFAAGARDNGGARARLQLEPLRRLLDPDGNNVEAVHT